jgi:hypothetical protein
MPHRDLLRMKAEQIREHCFSFVLMEPRSSALIRPYLCSFLGCSQPTVKKFVKGEGGIDQYVCTVKYIAGHNPDLVLEDNAGGIERVDLTKFSSSEALHELLTSKAVRRTAHAHGEEL